MSIVITRDVELPVMLILFIELFLQCSMYVCVCDGIGCMNPFIVILACTI